MRLVPLRLAASEDRDAVAIAGVGVKLVERGLLAGDGPGEVGVVTRALQTEVDCELLLYDDRSDELSWGLGELFRFGRVAARSVEAEHITKVATFELGNVVLALLVERLSVRRDQKSGGGTR